MKTTLIVPLLALLFLATSCPRKDMPPKKDPGDELPPITQAGANTFGCLVNGKVWLPGGGGLPAINAQYSQGTFSIGADKGVENTNGQLLIWAISPIGDTGKYYIKTGKNNLGASFFDHVALANYQAKDSDSLQNWIHVSKLDPSKLIISGTFNLFFIGTRHDTLRMTEGRFDTKYYY
jgi:hypothetical protein